MSFEQKKSKALDLLQKAGIKIAPLDRLLWRLGVGKPPMLFASLLSTFLTFSMLFGVLLPLGLILFLNVTLDENPVTAELLILLAKWGAILGTGFGIAAVVSVVQTRRKYKLPSWDSL